MRRLVLIYWNVYYCAQSLCTVGDGRGVGRVTYYCIVAKYVFNIFILNRKTLKTVLFILSDINKYMRQFGVAHEI